MAGFTLTSRFTAQNRVVLVALTQISKTLPGQKKDSQTSEVVLSLTRDAYLSLLTCLRQSYELSRYSPVTEDCVIFTCIPKDHFTKKLQQNSMEKTTPTNSTSEPRI